MSGELERFDPAEQSGRIVYEHLHRYALCREFVAGRRVLDLACGTGYGTAILGTAAAEVTGLDISAAAIRAARKRFAGDNVKFVIGDCFDLPFDDGSFDVIVANEMIEHVEDHPALLAEVRRVLASKGLFLVSTPNKPVYNRFKAPNAFHVAEMEIPEFRKLLRDRFKHVRLTGTRMALLSVGYAIDAGEDHLSSNLNAARVHIASGASAGKPCVDTGELRLDDPEYVLAMCSDVPLEEPALSSSLFFDQRQDLWLEHEKIMAWASGLHEEDEVLRADVFRNRELLEESRAHAARLETERAELVEKLEDMRASRGELGSSLENERQALARETEAVRREASARLATLAELLGRMASQPVAPDDAAIVSSLFQINEALVTERLQRALAEERSQLLSSRVEAIEREAAELAADRSQLAAELVARDEQVASERRLREELEAARRALEEELRAGAEESQITAAALAARTEELAARIEEAAAERQAREQLEAERAALEEDARNTADQLVVERQHRAELEASRVNLAQAVRETTNQLEIERQQREELEVAQSELAERVRAGAEASELAAALTERVQELEERLATRLWELAEETRRREQLEAACAALEEESRRAAELRLLAEIGASSAGAAPLAAAASRTSAARDSKGQADAALGVLHRRAAAMLASSHAQIAGSIAPPPARAPLPWHRRVLRKERVLETAIYSNVWLERQDDRLAELSLRRFLAESAYRTLSPHPLFDTAFYLEMHPDVAESGMSPLAHYVLHGWREGRDPHPLFTNDWYLAQNPDVAAHGALSALDHYLLHGWREGRRPNPLFNPRTYLERYPDVEAGDFEPLTHFILYGENEGRELAIEGWGQSLPDIALQGGALRAMERLLRDTPSEPTLPTPETVDAQVSAPTPWPPPPVDDFWPSQMMREMITEAHGEPLLIRIWYLLSLMNRWQDRQAEFANSDDCGHLLDRLRARANANFHADDHTPSATVIIPVYNNVLDTLLCLASLLELEERHDFDVIVADDGSTDATAALVTSIGGIVRYIRQPRNLGFLGNSNAAAMQARGETIILLNNDTLVFTGWLDGLLDPIAQFANVGLVGSKLINWDGTLQEAGGIFWRDGSAWNFGRNQDAQAPEFNYLKDVDYCSGASVAIPAAIWREVRGFDPVYSPAYCEDSDLAFRLREAGYRTLYSPASEVVHHEGRSHGRDVTSGIKAYQVTNQQRFLERWRPVLERDHYPNAQDAFRARDRSFARRHVLVIDHYLPQWDKDAGSKTMFDFVQVLIQAGHAVTFWPDNLWRDPEYAPRLQALGVEVIYGPRHRNGFEQFLADRQGLYDMVLLSRPHIAVNYVDAVRRLTEARIVYYGHDVHFRRMMAERQLAGLPAESEDVLAMKAQEVSVCNASDLVLYPSAEEADLIRELVSPAVAVRAIAAYCYLPDELAAARDTILSRVNPPEELHLLFVGGFGHPPNVDAAVWFCETVMPLLRGRRKVRLSIAGSRPPKEVIGLEQEDVNVLGFVSDERLRSLYREATMAIAPLRYGAGVKGKVIEAMARGLPVVTTSIGAQGIPGASQFLFLGDTPEEIAAEIMRAADGSAAKARALAALDFVEGHYSTEAMMTVFEAGFRSEAGKD